MRDVYTPHPKRPPLAHLAIAICGGLVAWLAVLIGLTGWVLISAIVVRAIVSVVNS